MSALPNVLREVEADSDSIYNCILNGIDDIPSGVKRTVITVQPNRADTTASRYPIPIISGSRRHPILPLYGIQLLSEAEELQIHQTVDLNDLFTMGMANKFLVKDEHGEVIFGGMENSSRWQRLLCGSKRRFILRLFDRTQQEAIFFIRRLAPISPFISCYLQRMDVFIPQCEYIGCVQQQWSPSAIILIVRNYLNENMFQVEGPLCFCCSSIRDMEFEVMRIDISQAVCRVSHKWDDSKALYVLNIIFLSRLDTKQKALILACTFLLEYIYFHVERSSHCHACV